MIWSLVAAAHEAAYFAVFQPDLPEDLRTPAVAMAYGNPPLRHLVMPVVGEFLRSAWVGSPKPNS